jgi:hypothetical protein
VIDLKIYGDVDNIVEISPNQIWLGGSSGEPLESTVKIKPNRLFSFDIVEVSAASGEFIETDLQKIDTSSGREYTLTVKNTKTTRGRYFDVLTLKTTSQYQPTIKIRVYASIK